MLDSYSAQVQLLIDVLPAVISEDVFALKSGIAHEPQLRQAHVLASARLWGWVNCQLLAPR